MLLNAAILWSVAACGPLHRYKICLVQGSNLNFQRYSIGYWLISQRNNICKSYSLSLILADEIFSRIRNYRLEQRTVVS